MKNRAFVKFCGINSVEAVKSAQNTGCNALGFVFVKQSKRYISPQQFKSLSKTVSPMMLKVALFANNSIEDIQEVVALKSFHVLQFHGEETNEFCKQWQIPFWKAVPMLDNISLQDYVKAYPDASGFVLDHFGENKMAGSGKAFDWNLLPKDKNYDWILAGGLSPHNVAEAQKISGLRHFDVSSGIESEPGVKSEAKMVQFIQEVIKEVIKAPRR